MANALRHETPFDAMLGEAPREIAARGLTISAAPVAAQIAVTGDMAASAAALGVVINQVPPALPNQIAGKEPYLLWLAPDKRLVVAEVTDRFEFGQRLD